MAAKELVEYVARALVDDPEAVKVEVVREDRRVRMGPGSVVGEMAVLDPQPRSATVSTNCSAVDRST